MSFLKINFSRLLVYPALLLTLVVSVAFQMPVSAQIGMEPFSIDKSNPKETGWFKYVVNPGDTVEDFVVLTNLGKEDVTAEIRSNDAIITEDGAFTIVSNEIENKELGSWVKLNDNKVTLPAEKSLKVPFSIKIPKDTKAGEYAGGLSILPVDNSNSGAPLSVKTRIGNRIYLTVKGGPLQINPDVKELTIINPGMADFAEQIRKRNFIKKDNLVFSISTENNGNVYNTLEATFKITPPSGKVVEQKFSRNLSPRSGKRVYFMETNLPYQVGETKLEVTYKVRPQNDYKEELKYEYQKEQGTLTTAINFKDSDIVEFDKARTTLDQPKKVIPNVQTNNGLAIQPEEKKPDVVAVAAKTEDNSKLIMYIGGGVGVLLLALIGLVAYKVLSDNKSKKDKPGTPAV